MKQTVQGFPLQAFLFMTFTATVVIFRHLSHSFSYRYVLTYNIKISKNKIGP